MRVGDDVLAAAARLAMAVAWDLIHFVLLDWLARNDQIDWSRAVVDSRSIGAVYRGNETGPNPTDRAKRGSKRHLICDTGRACRSRVAEPVRTGTTRKTPWRWSIRFPRYAAKAGDPGSARTVCSAMVGTTRPRFGVGCRHIVPLLAMRGPEHGSDLGPVPLGRGAHVCLAQSVSPLAGAVWLARRHLRGVPLARVRADLLAVAAQDVEDRLS